MRHITTAVVMMTLLAGHACRGTHSAGAPANRFTSATTGILVSVRPSSEYDAPIIPPFADPRT